MTTTTTISLDDTMKHLRAELKREFPGVKFSITRTRDLCIHVTWTDGPSRNAVGPIAHAYEGSQFDGMDDSEQAQYGVAADATGEPVRTRYGSRYVLLFHDTTVEA